MTKSKGRKSGNGKARRRDAETPRTSGKEEVTEAEEGAERGMLTRRSTDDREERSVER
jgi:hypothetical protein